MKNGKVIQIEETKPQSRGLVLTPEEKKRLTDFFVLLIEIDQRNKSGSNASPVGRPTTPSIRGIDGLNLRQPLMPAGVGFSALHRTKKLYHKEFEEVINQNDRHNRVKP